MLVPFRRANGETPVRIGNFPAPRSLSAARQPVALACKLDLLAGDDWHAAFQALPWAALEPSTGNAFLAVILSLPKAADLGAVTRLLAFEAADSVFLL